MEPPNRAETEAPDSILYSLFILWREPHVAVWLWPFRMPDSAWLGDLGYRKWAVIIGFVNLTPFRHIWKGDVNSGTATIRLSCEHIYGTFSWLMTGMGRSSPLCMVPPWQAVLGCIRANWASHKEQTSKHFPPWSLLQSLPPGSSLDFLLQRTVSCTLKETLSLPSYFWTCNLSQQQKVKLRQRPWESGQGHSRPRQKKDTIIFSKREPYWQPLHNCPPSHGKRRWAFLLHLEGDQVVLHPYNKAAASAQDDRLASTNTLLFKTPTIHWPISTKLKPSDSSVIETWLLT